MRRGGPLRRTPLSRGKPLERRSRLDQGKSELNRTKMKQRSTKRSAVMKDSRVPMIKGLIDDGRKCELGPILYGIGLTGCTGEIQGIHERRKRSAGGSLTNPANLIPACHWCNGAIEDNAGLVRATTRDLLVVRQGDNEWDGLGARNDR